MMLNKYWLKLMRNLFMLLLIVGGSSSSFAGIQTCKELLGSLVGHVLQRQAEAAIPNEDVPIEWPHSLVQRADLKRGYFSKVERFFEEGQQGILPMKDGLVLPYRVFKTPNERGAVVIVVGMRESITKWQEQIYSLTQEGYSVYLMDHRGQGHSPRVTKNSQVVHIDTYDHYVSDLREFVTQVVKKDHHPLTFVLGNSMGGLISTLYIDKYPKDFDAVMSTVPAIDIQIKGIPKPIARLILGGQFLFGRGKEYTLGQKDFHLIDLKKYAIPGYEPRFRHVMENFFRYPITLMGGPSNGWLWATLNAVKKIARIPERSQVPMLMIESGKDETVKPEAITDFANRSPVTTHYIEPEGTHLVYFSKDEIRTPIMAEMYRYMINPIRLDVPDKRNEVRRLINDAEQYMRRGEVALARYAKDEAYRVLEWKKGQRTEWDTEKFKERMEAINDQVESAYETLEPGQKGFYLYLSWRRLEEMKKLYPDSPKP